MFSNQIPALVQGLFPICFINAVTIMSIFRRLKTENLEREWLTNKKKELSPKMKSSRPIDVSTLELPYPCLYEWSDQQVQIEGPHWSY